MSRSYCPRRLMTSCFFFNDTATTEIYTLSLHDALPILRHRGHGRGRPARRHDRVRRPGGAAPAEALRGAPPRPAPSTVRLPGRKPARARRHACAHRRGARRAARRGAHRDDRRAGPASPPREAALMLAASGLTLTAGGRELVRALDLSLAPGQCWALLGRNGAGKTSLIRALAGLRAPQAGAVALDGVALSAMRRRDLALRVSVLLQDEESDFWGRSEEHTSELQ